MTDPNAYTLTGLGALLILNVGKWIQDYFQYKKSSEKGNGKPGKTDICVKHGEDIAVLKANIKSIDKTLGSMDEKLNSINKSVNGGK